MRKTRNPESTRLELTQGDWLLVKKRLTAGESRRVFTRMVKTMHGGGEKIELDPMQVGRSQACEYLLDWGEFVDAAGKPLVVRDQSPEEIGATLDTLDPDDFQEVVDAIGAHDKAQDAARAEEKKVATTATAP